VFKKKRNTCILIIYLLLAFAYYFVGSAIRALIFTVIVSISLMTFLNFQKNRVFYIRSIISKFLLVFIFVFFIQLFNATFSPFVFYIISTPLISLFILNNKFDARLLKIPLYLSALVFSAYFVQHRTLHGVYAGISENYVSVVMIMNVILINMIEVRQKKQISILPSVVCLIFSLLAVGRSGILCATLLFLNVISARWMGLSKGVKWGVFLLVFLPTVGFVVSNIGLLIKYGEGLTIMEKFSESGMESHSRSIILNEYLAHMSLENIFLGYNFENNYWFKHYGLNPHNSYIRLHHYFGFLFFVVMLFIIRNLYRLFRHNRFLAGCAFVILLRAYTDTLLFQYIYDFVLLSLLLIPSNKKLLVVMRKRWENSLKMTKVNRGV